MISRKYSMHVTLLSNVNTNFMNKIFQVKDITYELRNSNNLCQPKFNKITYDKNTFSYYTFGTHYLTIYSYARDLTIIKHS